MRVVPSVGDEQQPLVLPLDTPPRNVYTGYLPVGNAAVATMSLLIKYSTVGDHGLTP